VIAITLAGSGMCAVRQFQALTAEAPRREDAPMAPQRFAALLFALTALGARAGDAGNSTTILGPSMLLTQGTEAMIAEQWQRGVELIERGLKETADVSERAAGYSNLCAGYIALRDYDRALANCDEALKLDTRNWRTYNNRAGALMGKGRLDEALHDVEYGLALNPEGQILLKMDSLVRARLKSLYEPVRPARDAATQS
jgi:tetratricopeptide (TPR) repeat protein